MLILWPNAVPLLRVQPGRKKVRHYEPHTFQLMAGFVLLAIALWAGQSYMEAQAYNHVTGKSVSTWDAMWIELRVQDQPK